MMKIRPVDVRDQAEWLRMRLALWPYAGHTEHMKEMSQYLVDSSQAVFVADRGDGRLAGFLEAGSRSVADGCDSQPVGYIEGWYVDADVRQQGVGRTLVEAAENWARQCGYREMASDCLIDNSTSFKAHLRLGYQEANRLIHFRKLLD
jgi:aminoglycoside 6'-N-acetyltransferase I